MLNWSVRRREPVDNNSRSNTIFMLSNELAMILNKVKPTNLSLWFYRFVKFREESEGVYKPSLENSVGNRLNLPSEAYQLYRNYINLLKTLKQPTFSAKNITRLVVGLGQANVFEVSIKLHRNYGFPFIPGSSLKGIAKSYSYMLFNEVIDKNLSKELRDIFDGKKSLGETKIDKNEYVTLKDKTKSVILSLEEALEIFGTQTLEGDIIFFDSFPDPDTLSLEFDIMAPHYGPYYVGDAIPGDWHDPTIIKFLTISRGAKFYFWLSSRNNNSSLLKKAVILLKCSLSQLGVGAKTALGYGLFSIDQ
ncbi:MAG: type III-B CRISPR module RAMP protein Cmr6 [Candidatus Asgardarchaeia archaeon]